MSARSRLLRRTLPAVLAVAATTAVLPSSAGAATEDTTPPTVTIKLDQQPRNGWFARDVTFTVTASDGRPSGLGVAVTTWKLSGATTGSGTFDAATGGTVASTGEGSTRLDVSATDDSGNTGFNQLTVRVDKTAPTVTFGGVAHGDVLVKGAQAPVFHSCDDVGSGLEGCASSLPNGSPADTTTVGPHDVTVVATDLAGLTTRRVLSYSVVDRFTVVRRPAITGPDQVGGVVDGVPGQVTPAPEAQACSWFLDGQDLQDAAPSHVLAAEETGRDLTYACTFARSGLPNLTVVSDPLRVEPAQFGELISTPVVAGSGAVGAPLTVGYQDLEPTFPRTEGVQWTRDGAAIPGASGRSYVVTAADQGHRLSAVVRATAPGYVPRDFPAGNSVAVPAATEKPPGGTPGGAVATSAMTLRAKALGHRKVRVTVTVTAAGTTPAGTVELRKGAKRLGSCALARGRCTVVLKRLAAGRLVLRAAYAGTTTVTAAAARTTVRVR